ncbi:MAG: flavin-dependent monooxygenase [Pseudomonadota bacterium]
MSQAAIAEPLVQDSINMGPYLDGIAGRAEEGTRTRKLPEATIQDFIDSGLFLSFLPKKLGGAARKPQEFFRAQIDIAEADMSSGWVAGIIACHAYQLALMDPQAQSDVYGQDPNTRISSSYNPMGGKVEDAPGKDGLMLSGRWGWSSGCDHCSWVLLGAIVPGEGYRTFLLPRADYEIEDTWFSMGLQGTGSNDIVISEPVFVPHYRTHKMMDGFNCQHKQDDPLYSIPWAQIFIRIVSSPAIGAVKHALKLFMDASGASSTDPTKLRSDQDILRRLAEVEHAVDVAETILFRNFDALVENAQNGVTTPMSDRIKFRYQASIVIDNMIKAIDTLYEVAGGRSVYEGSPIQKIWHDVHITRAHVANNPVPFARNMGNVMLGGENTDYFI